MVAAAGISKGGLYEYIASKEDLYLYCMQQTWSSLYRYIKAQAALAATPLPDDILERFMTVSRIAIEWYLLNPSMLGLIVRIARLPRDTLAAKAEAVFDSHFAEVFSGLDSSRLAYPVEQLVELITWLLAKTRKDALLKIDAGKPLDEVRRLYLQEWAFFLFGVEQGNLPHSLNLPRTYAGNRCVRFYNRPTQSALSREYAMLGLGDWGGQPGISSDAWLDRVMRGVRLHQLEQAKSGRRDQGDRRRRSVGEKGNPGRTTMNATVVTTTLIYLAITAGLGYLGYTQTTNAKDYLLAGRKVHPVIMAISYGSTFISTAAIVGFGGAAAVFGMGILWLTVLNIFLGIFIAFVVFGKRTRRMGHQLDAHTFPEFLGKRYDSKFLQVAAAALIFIGMPLYAGAVMLGGVSFLTVALGLSQNMALLTIVLIVGAYVMMGGMKGVMYTDAFQGGIMLIGMLVLLWYAYSGLGGVVSAHEQLTAMADKVPAALVARGHHGWTAMPESFSPLWWTLISTVVMGRRHRRAGTAATCRPLHDREE